ncbi:hypothetical protein HAN_2g363 (nucleomorph) [Hemiselmis andersenii]|uniref:Uncharacterized protein n=1 Tax=Hemiselmis andersenii TaxID=464988 RepID=A9BKK8_HEMAN|nr:hypothetical protein HAN_2g186 [Hemiselmis andersenii]XP_001712504.1 hypothetical protein HAN_2g363 [Hemiselmis andersenii]ABW98016.1 hypothetical protein HAN_2g186 [Hemiselmis andersenii]ABW98179.1 hypothetical protein HAN_2g363 [Hemiselmis andersenii]
MESRRFVFLNFFFFFKKPLPKELTVYFLIFCVSSKLFASVLLICSCFHVFFCYLRKSGKLP